MLIVCIYCQPTFYFLVSMGNSYRWTLKPSKFSTEHTRSSITSFNFWYAYMCHQYLYFSPVTCFHYFHSLPTEEMVLIFIYLLIQCIFFLRLVHIHLQNTNTIAYRWISVFLMPKLSTRCCLFFIPFLYLLIFFLSLVLESL